VAGLRRYDVRKRRTARASGGFAAGSLHARAVGPSVKFVFSVAFCEERFPQALEERRGNPTK
jgi:aromatic ring-cleaving dioxygenase